MRTYGIGIIGWGFMGQTHALAIRTLPLFYAGAGFRAEIRCICTRREEVARQAAADMGADWTCDYRELLKRDDIDVVSVCTPNAQHEQMALDAVSYTHLDVYKRQARTGDVADDGPDHCLLPPSRASSLASLPLICSMSISSMHSPAHSRSMARRRPSSLSCGK